MSEYLSLNQLHTLLKVTAKNGYELVKLLDKHEDRVPVLFRDRLRLIRNDQYTTWDNAYRLMKEIEQLDGNFTFDSVKVEPANPNAAYEVLNTAISEGSVTPEEVYLALFADKTIDLAPEQEGGELRGDAGPPETDPQPPSGDESPRLRVRPAQAQALRAMAEGGSWLAEGSNGQRTANALIGKGLAEPYSGQEFYGDERRLQLTENGTHWVTEHEPKI
jgi:hypothetical protein